MSNAAPRRTGKDARRPPADDLAAERERDLRVVAHVRLGKGFDEIARIEEFADRSGAWRAFWRVVKRNEAAEVERMRAAQGEQIDAGLEKWLPMFLGGDRYAAAVVIRLWERQAKLWGMDRQFERDAENMAALLADPQETVGRVIEIRSRIAAAQAAAPEADPSG